MRIAVTGASSLIGATLVESLLQRGDQVVAFQRGQTDSPDRPTPGPGELVTHLGDVRDAAALDVALERCDVVVHLAAKVGVVGSRDEYASVNIDGTRNVIAAAQRHGARGVVHVSTPSVAHDGRPIVGGRAEPPIVEHGTAWYPETKAIAERRALDSSDERCAVVAVRPHLVWGPGDTQLVGRIVERAENGRLALVGAGRSLVDTTYVENAASALVAAVDAIAPGAACAGKAYVVSNGEPRPIRELVEAFCVAADVPFEPRNVPLGVARRIGSVVDAAWPRLHREDEPPLTRFLADQLGTAHWFDQRNVRADLGWRPSVSIDEGLAALGDWYRARRGEAPSR
ncbi:NAD-dependent epimerase/dehydratase family protein [Ilumatobacter nonamiensis]|uniref:NAD-dependent epimerase/dehydratase family protein n=1 Tax=Ilumatobacter nonamiensis TaxID=467093 RepID=UPI00034DCDF6|nr:NAD-dependent epimerase/dehydratase family protein [Ilumatobacter nonamiensis]